jgi:hypothetical protein
MPSTSPDQISRILDIAVEGLRTQPATTVTG